MVLGVVWSGLGMVLGAVHRIGHLRNLICVIGVGKFWVLSGISSHIHVPPEKYN